MFNCSRMKFDRIKFEPTFVDPCVFHAKFLLDRFVLEYSFAGNWSNFSLSVLFVFVCYLFEDTVHDEVN